jgi:hypothetical protein
VHDLEGPLSAYLCGIHAMTACTRIEKPWLDPRYFPTGELHGGKRADHAIRNATWRKKSAE